MRVFVHVRMYVYVYMCVCVYVCIYMYIHTRVGVHMHSCRCMLLICTVQSMRVYHRCFFNTGMRVWVGIGSGGFVCLYCPISLLHARVSQVFLNTACVRVGGLEVGFVSACSWLALVTGVGGYVLAGVEKGVLSCLFLYFCGC